MRSRVSRELKTPSHTPKQCQKYNIGELLVVKIFGKIFFFEKKFFNLKNDFLFFDGESIQEYLSSVWNLEKVSGGA